MNYQEELRAKLDAVRLPTEDKKGTPVDTITQEERILGELGEAFEFARYDLDESDLLRTLKIHAILAPYRDAFSHPDALRLFYTLARVDVILPKNLHAFLGIPAHEFKAIIKALARHRLLTQNDAKELELSLDGKSLAARIGLDFFF